jgi:hypothetical protein
MNIASTILNAIIDQRAAGSAVIERTLKTRLMLKGINIDKILSDEADDPIIVAKLTRAAEEMDIKLPDLTT